MSGTGAACAPRAQRHWDPTNGCDAIVAGVEMEAAAAGAATERAAAIDHVRRKLAVAQRDPANDHLVRVLDELAEDFSRGLHLR